MNERGGEDREREEEGEERGAEGSDETNHGRGRERDEIIVRTMMLMSYCTCVFPLFAFSIFHFRFPPLSSPSSSSLPSPLPRLAFRSLLLSLLIPPSALLPFQCCWSRRRCCPSVRPILRLYVCSTPRPRCRSLIIIRIDPVVGLTQVE